MAETAVMANESKYTVGMFKSFLIRLVNHLLSFLSLGLLKPVVLWWQMKTEVENTYIDGKKLVFTGTIGAFYKKYIIWLLLSWVTFSIYAWFVLPKKTIEWQCENTHFEGEEGGVSTFDGTAGQIFKLNVLGKILGFFAPNKAFVKRKQFFASHVVIDGQRLAFTATAKEWKKYNRKTSFLIIITLFIYSIWVPSKQQQWIISKMHVA